MVKKEKQPGAKNKSAPAEAQAAAEAAYDIASCFKNMQWQVISFFPNTLCRPEEKDPSQAGGK